MRRFQILIEGTVKPDPETAKLEGQSALQEMRAAVEMSFRPDLQWGVEMTSMDITMPESEEGDSDG